jgi:hypothetical protein
MTSGQDVSEYLDTLSLVKSYFFKFFEEKNIEKKSRGKMSWCSDAPEDEANSLFAGLLANPDVPLSPRPMCMRALYSLSMSSTHVIHTSAAVAALAGRV